MIAALPMYDWPEERPAVDALWARIRDALRDAGLDAPEDLARSDDLRGQWRHPDLLLGQTCGLPYAAELHGHVHLIGSLDARLERCPPGHSLSVIVARADDGRPPADLLAARPAVNSDDSQSGWGALALWAAALGLPIRTAPLATGAHAASALAIAEGRADIAAIDAASWRLLRRHRPGLAARLRTLDETPPTPGLPLIAARRFDPDIIARALDTALGPGALVRFSPEDYIRVPRLPFPEAI